MNLNTAEEFDRIWDREKDAPEKHDRDKVFFKRIIEIVKDAKSVVDAGCGVGVVLRKLTNKTLTGIDFSAVAVRSLPAHVSGLVSDLRTPPTIKRHEYVICTETLEHFDDIDLKKVILNLARMAEKFVFSVPIDFADPFHIQIFTKENIKPWIDRVSDKYKIEEVEENGYHYLIVHGTFKI